MLIKPVYSGTIDTPEDMLESSAQLAVLRGSAHAVSLKEDPRPAVQRLYEGHIVATIATKHGLVIPDYLKERYCTEERMLLIIEKCDYLRTRAK